MTFFQKIRKSKKGFTLIELIVVISIISILAAILIPSMVSYIKHSQNEATKSDTRAVYAAACVAYNVVKTDGSNPAFLNDYSDTGVNFGGNDPSGLGYETIIGLGKQYEKSKISVTANGYGVLSVTYKNWRYDAKAASEEDRLKEIE